MKWIAAIVITGVLLILLFAYPDIMISPGELSQGHQDLKHSCLSCHTPFGGIDNERCISCHKVEEIGRDSTLDTGKLIFHKALISQACISCHSDHAGLHPESTVTGFNHDLLDASMINKCVSCHAQPADDLHQQVTNDCISCHDTNAWKLTKPFNHDLLAADRKTNCASCHKAPTDDLHLNTTGNCDQCHTTSQWVPSTFAHNDYFVLDQDHNAKCNVCHLANNYKAYTCYGCHEHSEAGMLAEHSEEGISNIRDCVSCHKSANEDDAQRNMERGNGGQQNEQGNEEDD